MRYVIDKTRRPAYLQLYKAIRDDIIGGIYPYNAKLPSERTLAEETGLSTITVEHAYGLLFDEGYAQSRERSGYYVIFRSSDGFAASSDRYDRVFGQPPAPPPRSLFPISVLCKTMRKVLGDYYDAILEKTQGTGCAELRGAIRDYLARNRGIRVCADRIVVGSGAEYLYGLLITMFGKDTVYAVESPSYEKIEKIYLAAGVKYETLPLTCDGIETNALFASSADVLHTTPYRSYPSGVTASASKRHEYIRWSDEKENRYIIESDYGSEFAVASQPMETLFALADRDNVIYLNTFARTISPSLRIGYMVLPERLVPLFDEKVGFYSCSLPTFEQYVLAELLGGGDFERHINRVRRNMRKGS